MFEKLQACYLIKKTLAQVFSCEFCEILRTLYFYRTPPVAACYSPKLPYNYLIILGSGVDL